MVLTIDLSPDKEAALKAQAKAHGLSTEEWLQQLVDEQLSFQAESDDRPVSEMISEIWANMPEDVRAKLPADGASEHDHYIYGWPKRNP